VGVAGVPRMIWIGGEAWGDALPFWDDKRGVGLEGYGEMNELLA
jgi:hypothetical protein